MNSVEKIIKDYGERLNEFRSPLSEDWKVLIFKSVDILHHLEKEDFLKTRQIVIENLNPLILKGYEDELLDSGIKKIKKLMYKSQGIVTIRLQEVLDNLCAVGEFMKSNY